MSALQAAPALAARVGTVLGSRHSRLAVATVASGSVSVATAGVPLDADFDRHGCRLLTELTHP